MMIVMQEGATEEQIRHVVERIEQAGARAHPSRGEFVTVIGAIGDDREIVASLQLEGEPGVEKVVPILKPYKLVSSDFRGRDAVVEVAGRRIGGGSFGLIAGPCAVESREQTLASARACKAAGATLLRGGAYKPRTSPYAFQGLGKPALEILAEAREETGLPIVTELMDVAPARGRARGRRHDPARRAQHAELRPAARGRPHRRPGAAQARHGEHGRGVAAVGRVHRPRGQRRHRALRARHPHLRDGHPLDARHLRRPGRQERSRACR